MKFVVPGVVGASVPSEVIPFPYERLLVALLVPLTLMRWFLAASFELCGDEAYYWLWAQHLDWAYYSKGPGVAAVIWLSTHLFGDSAFGVRALVPVFAAATTAGVFVLGRSLYEARIGFWAAVAVSLMPMSAAGGLLQTIDPMSMCLWTWSLVVLARVSSAPSAGLWFAAGLLIGAGALAKYTNLFLVPSFILFCLFSRAHRPLLRTGGFALMLVTVLACLAPVLIWQLQHGWVTVTHLKQRGAFGVAPRLSAGEFASFLGLQLAVSFPVLIGVALAIPVLRRTQDKRGTQGQKSGAYDAPLAFLLALSLPLFASYAAMAWVKSGEPNWVAPSYIGFAVLAVAGVLRRGEASGARVWRRVSAGALGLALVLNTVVLLSPVVPLPHDTALKGRVQGAAQLAAAVSKAQASHGAGFVIGGHYQIASLVSFYTPGHPGVFTPTSAVAQNQFFYWPGYQQLKHEGENAVYVSRDNAVPPILEEEFRAVRLLQEFTPSFKGRPLKPYYLFLCEQLRAGGER